MSRLLLELLLQRSKSALSDYVERSSKVASMAAKVGFLNLPVEYRGVAESFRRKLRAENKSEHTIAAYSLAVRQFGEYLEVKGLPTDPVHITREHVESFLSDLLEAGCSCLPFPEV